MEERDQAEPGSSRTSVVKKSYNAIQARRIYPFVCMTAIKLTQQKCGDLELNPCVCVLSWQGGP